MEVRPKTEAHNRMILELEEETDVSRQRGSSGGEFRKYFRVYTSRYINLLLSAKILMFII